MIAERSDLRCFLSVGMVLTGLSCGLFGMGRFWGVRGIAYYLLVQVYQCQ